MSIDWYTFSDTSVALLSSDRGIVGVGCCSGLAGLEVMLASEWRLVISIVWYRFSDSSVILPSGVEGAGGLGCCSGPIGLEGMLGGCCNSAWTGTPALLLR